MLNLDELFAGLGRTALVAGDFAGHWLLLGPLAIVAGAIFLGIGRGVGLPYLFWHEDRWKQAAAGVAATLLGSQSLFVSFLLDTRPLGASGSAPRLVALSGRDYLLHGWLALFAALLVPITLFLLGKTGVRPLRRWPFVAGAAVGGLVTAALVALGEHLAKSALRAECKELPGWMKQTMPAATCQEVFHLHVLAALFFLLLFVTFVAGALARGRWSSPAAGLCVLLGILALTQGFCSFWLGALPELFAVAGVLALVAIAGLDRYKRYFPALEAYYPKRRHAGARAMLDDYPIGGDAPGPLTSSTEIAWKGALPWSRRKRPLVLVCVSGGGIRSAAWTAAVLCELEKRLPGFPYHVRLVSGASGGMVGASAYVASLRPPAEVSGPDDERLHGVTHDELVAAVGSDCLSQLSHTMFFRDIPFTFLPFRNAHDRGTALENAFKQNAPWAFGATMGDLRAGEVAGWRPSLVFSPMLVEDGRRLVISNLDLDALFSQSGPRVGQRADILYSRSGYELGRLFPDAHAEFPLATAARMSASFPYFSPATLLPTIPRRQVVDAGYWDNYGVSIACGWLDEGLKREGDNPGAMTRWIEENVSRILLLQIRDGVAALCAEAGTVQDVPEPGPLGRGLEWLSPPIEGTLAAQKAVMLFRNDEQLEAVIKRYDRTFGRGFLTTTTLALRKKVSLSWYLTSEEKDVLRAEAQSVVAEAASDLRAWWGEEEAADREAVA
jgi:hypothetical protein